MRTTASLRRVTCRNWAIEVAWYFSGGCPGRGETLPSVHCKMNSSWHSRFNPQQFLRGVNLERLLRRNELFEGNGLVAGTAPCVMCGNAGGSVLVLNDRRVVCKSCFERLSFIQYPELYETSVA